MAMTSTMKGSGTIAGPESHVETDGRVLRRNRNMDAVRGAIVELLSERADLNIPLVARRAGVASRSVYRYYGDLESAVRDAVTNRLELAIAPLPSPDAVDSTRPVSERINRVSRERVGMWCTASPVLGHIPDEVVEAAMRRLDGAILATFSPELERFDPAVRACAESTLAVLVRMRTINSIAGRCEHDLTEMTSVLRFGMRSVLLPAL